MANQRRPMVADPLLVREERFFCNALHNGRRSVCKNAHSPSQQPPSPPPVMFSSEFTSQLKLGLQVSLVFLPTFLFT